MAAPHNRQRGNPPARNQSSPAGDFTGRERQRLLEENAEEVAEAQKRVGLMTADDRVAEEHGVFDPENQAVVDGFADMDEAAQAEPILFEEEGGVFDPEAPQSNPSAPRAQEPVTQQKPEVLGQNPYEVAEEPPLPDRAVVLQSPVMVFRVNSDIEEMTFGRHVTEGPDGEQIVGELRVLSFFRGRRYKAPRDVYDHLESKGLVYH